MTTALGPYEPHGAYGVLAESEVFDTSGTGSRFCPNCEHEPCVAGGKNRCSCSPRIIVVLAIGRRIDDAIVPLYNTHHHVWLALTEARLALNPLASTSDFPGALALRALAQMADALEQKPEADR
jgi:hypothetical protein